MPVLSGVVLVLLTVHDLVLHAAEQLLGLLLCNGVGDAEVVDVGLARGRHVGNDMSTSEGEGDTRQRRLHIVKMSSHDGLLFVEIVR